MVNHGSAYLHISGNDMMCAYLSLSIEVLCVLGLVSIASLTSMGYRSMITHSDTTLYTGLDVCIAHVRSSSTIKTPAA